ncbi:hypothetical protein OKA05_27790 [Luteolibacter arcticus]|uniref:HNH endonuclease n=1 Tax=Luteolibacter arcticus TaxID=1581411 RepID=A0ABT3GSB4_9BACT|nr:hypothetical protein [Luteolibacter arcticus]MCW1926385.1 hypothetical protein [Luteolibacter arcticus]
MATTNPSPIPTTASDRSVKRRCEWCHQLFTAPARGNGGRQASYCSNAHKQAAYRARKSAAPAENL